MQLTNDSLMLSKQLNTEKYITGTGLLMGLSKLGVRWLMSESFRANLDDALIQYIKMTSSSLYLNIDKTLAWRIY